MTDAPETEADPFPNVVTFGRKSHGEVRPYIPPVEPEPTPRERIVAKEIDTDAILMLEGLLADFRAGKHHGIALVAGVFNDVGTLVNYRSILSPVACSYPISFTGAIENVKVMLGDMAIDLCEEGGEPLDIEDELAEYELYDEDD